MPKLRLELSSEDLKRLVVKELERRLGDVPLDPAKVSIEVKSSQNYRAEWEAGDFRATYEVLGFQFGDRG